MSSNIKPRLLDYLSFQENAAAVPLSFNESDWQSGLAMTDRAGLTFHLLARLKKRNHFHSLPVRIRERLDKNEIDHTARLAAMSREFLEFNRQLQSQSIRYLVLKGPTYFPDFVDSLHDRVQYDHDFLMVESDLERAYTLFLGLGYAPLEKEHKLAVDHLPTLVKKTGWIWRGNLYDPEIPRAVELHFRLWDSDFESIPIRFPEDLWSRSINLIMAGESIPTLCREHTLFHAVLHTFRHLLRNDLRLSHLYELSYFVHTHAEDSAFWKGFVETLQSRGESRRIAATMFQLSEHCFGNRASPIVQQLIHEHLSPGSALWIERFGRTESVECFRKSRSALLLQMDFLNSWSSKWKLVLRKWIPRHLPSPSFGVQTPEARQNFGFRLYKKLRYGLQILGRLLFQVFNFTRFLIEFPIWQCRLHFLRSSSQPAGESPRPMKK